MDAIFSGDKKVGKSLLHNLEQRFIVWAVPKVPASIQTYHLTLATIPISLLIIIFSFFAVKDVFWLWGVSVMIVMQWLTDSLDGAVGRARNTGLIRWGYYMDHLLDYFFLASIMIGYMILLPDKSKWIFFFIFSLVAGFMINSFLVMAATNKFRIAHLGIGPTEIRLVFIVINTLLIFLGKTHLAFSMQFILPFSFLGLVIVIGKEQKKIWEMDMVAKQLNDKNKV
ncbi:MAG: CDP-alcohol phosphatidyltransferase family protein [Candidatus Magasanikbacteria bacterium]|nr:CDP-alcohol phosphatidyltransferase family protein [Candidatus Magasanikbacteria bacterium]